jgi:hypothetical protein
MNKIDQNIAIAKVCGWTQIENANTMAVGGIWKGYPPTHQLIGEKEYIPDYTSDLNEMHKAEKCEAMRHLFDDYLSFLEHICGLAYPICATASQRAEALLRTVDRWKF